MCVSCLIVGLEWSIWFVVFLGLVVVVLYIIDCCFGDWFVWVWWYFYWFERDWSVGWIV